MDRRRADDEPVEARRSDGNTDRAIDALLDKLWAPEPSAGLVGRLYAASAAARDPRARSSAFSPSRPWAIAAAAATVIVGTAYLSTGDHGLVSTTARPVAASAPDTRMAAAAVRLGAVHPADASTDEGEPDGDDLAVVDASLDEPEVPLI